MNPTGFYAYASESSHLSDTIETAIKAINNRNEVRLESWRGINIGGRVVIKTILNRIKSADIFVGDITGLNPNVLFELGFAIGLRKRVWLTLDTTKANSVAQIKSLEILNEIGYRPHVNHDDIISQFLKDRPHLDLQGHVLQDHDSLISGILKSPTSNDVFYIPSSVEGSAVKRIAAYFSSLREHNERRVVVYDELENNTERLRWYLRNILEANATIAHLDDVDSENAQINNARCSLLAGIALGFDRKVLMIAPTPFDPPFDYRDLLCEYKNARQCKQAVELWLRPIFLTRVERKPLKLDSELALLEFHIGEPTAENEEVELRNYFVPTPAYSAGTRNKVGIFVGRKGTGKTANLYQLRDYHSWERKNLVVTIKPLSFRIAAFGRLLTDYFHRPEDASDFVERIWRAIIYSEVAVAVSRRIGEDTRFREPTIEEAAVLSHVDRHRDFVEADFGDKIDAIRDLIQDSIQKGGSPKAALQTIAIDYSKPLVHAYSSMFQRFQRVVVLVDNLDKAWGLEGDLPVQKQLIFGLFEFQNTIRRDLSLTKGDIRLLIFLREDIFTHVMTEAYEPDKIRLDVSRVTWPHREQLVEILEKRFLAHSSSLNSDSIWTDLFCPDVDGIDTKDFFLDHIMPRPRDLIHVIHTAIDNCVGRAHSRIESDDLRDSLKEYYQFLLDNMSAEYGVYIPEIRNMIQSFAGTKSRQNGLQIRTTIRDYLRSSGGLENIVSVLFRVSFVGIEHGGRVKYVYTNDEAKRLLPLLRRRLYWYNLWRTHFVIHPAFRGGLETANA